MGSTLAALKSLAISILLFAGERETESNGVKPVRTNVDPLVKVKPADKPCDGLKWLTLLLPGCFRGTVKAGCCINTYS